MGAMRNMVGRIRRRLSDARISTRILLFYGSLLILSVVLSSVIYQNVYQDTISGKVRSVSMQTLYSISANIETMVENARNLSKVIITSDEIQNPLKERKRISDSLDGASGGAVDAGNLDTQRIVNAHLSRFLDGFPFISSIYIFDSGSRRYGIDKFPLKALTIGSIEKAPWYGDAVQAQGGFILRRHAGGVLSETPEDTYMSLIRIVNDIYTQEPVGVMILNIAQTSFAQAWADIRRNYDTDIRILDESGAPVVDFRNPQLLSLETLEQPGEREGSIIRSVGGRDYLFSHLRMEQYGWRIVSAMPFDELSRESTAFYGITIAIILFNAIVLFMGTVVISRMISTPIHKLLVSMKGVERGEFVRVDIEAGNDEIGKLRDAYNLMITQIQTLIERVVEDQRLKRKGELDVLQAQIKPHFLYNTFDAISSLALSGRNDEVYRLMKALGSYYRISLSKGSEVITVAEEVEVVKNYMAIQQVRYGDIFTAHYDMDETAGGTPILKLILQPLAENALYHGIKPKGEPGNIWVSVRRDEEQVVLSVRDDGVGMRPEFIRDVMSPDLPAGRRSGFGLRGTLERLRIFYGIAEPMTIESEWGEGTTITIRVPAKGKE